MCVYDIIQFMVSSYLLGIDLEEGIKFRTIQLDGTGAGPGALFVGGGKKRGIYV